MLIRVREGKDAGKSLVSIHNIPELKGIEMEADGTIVIRLGRPLYQVWKAEGDGDCNPWLCGSGEIICG